MPVVRSFDKINTGFLTFHISLVDGLYRHFIKDSFRVQGCW